MGNTTKATSTISKGAVRSTTNTTPNYGFGISTGSDLVNPLTDLFPNWTALDTILKRIDDSGVGSATELKTLTVHSLTRATNDEDKRVFTFTATSNFEAGETFTVDNTQVTALTPDGQTLSTGAFIIGSEVLCVLRDTLLTVFVNPAKAKDSEKLDGHAASYFATDADLGTTNTAVGALQTKVGSAILTTQAQDCSGAINELNTHLSDVPKITDDNGTLKKVYVHTFTYPANNVAVNLPLPSGMFSEPPLVFATMAIAGGYTVAITDESTTQFTAYVRLNNQVPTVATAIKIIAVGN